MADHSTENATTPNTTTPKFTKSKHKFLGANSNQTQISTWLCIAR